MILEWLWWGLIYILLGCGLVMLVANAGAWFTLIRHFFKRSRR